ncbi:DUF3094 family protein [Gilvimarinus xylanilyticus]|uniref:DUF3094 domain-containing protein n=1 Tax=Gilvimarinus xylanilyticus TaxID=2944139 RepID=A0A9X2I2T3_9GAMM|nr:DUF3094 family protein [Gilvimarinus xylanilyticus]MCP8899783.1 DUF3094 domain-containing protein [Gilvimarinus xylanilyticus]
MPSKLNPEDQARVDKVLRQGANRVERKPFKVWTLFAVLLLVLTLMSGVSYWIAWQYGVV